MASLLAAAQLVAPIAKQQQQQQQQHSQVQISGSRNRAVVLNRRETFMASGAAAATAFLSLADGAHAAKGEVETAEEIASNPLIQKLLESSRANKAAYDAARLEDYYKRNFKEYFEFVEGSVRNKKEMTPAEKAIVQWLESHK